METKLVELVTGTEMKPWLSRNMLPNINTCENGWSNFSANLRVLSLNLLELTQFAWPNLSIYFNFSCTIPRDDVIESPRFFWWGHQLIIPPWGQWSSFFYIYFGCTFEHFYGIYIIARQGRIWGIKMSIWGYNQKTNHGCLQPSFGKCAEHWRFGTPHSARVLLLLNS